MMIAIVLIAAMAVNPRIAGDDPGFDTQRMQRIDLGFDLGFNLQTTQGVNSMISCSDPGSIVYGTASNANANS